MISAAPTFGQSALDLFKLALTMAQYQDGSVPQSLQDYFIQTLNEAKAVAQNPQNIPSNISPEAIELAVDILNGRFDNDFEGIKRFNQITPAVAKSLLENMEAYPVYQNGLSPFAGLAN